jgi:hypothetical protein
VTLTTAFDIVFAVGVVGAAVAVVAAAANAVPRSTALAATGGEGGAALAAWIAFALRPAHPRELAVAAGGLTACAITCAASLLVLRALARAAQVELHLTEAEQRLHGLVDREAAERAAELERTLARARADSVSLLVEEERKLAEQHRQEFADREREAGATLTSALTATQTQVEQRLAAWTQDLDRIADATRARIAELGQRQKQLVSEAELRIAADAERLAAESEELRASLQRVRSDVEKAIVDSLAAAQAEVDAHAAERRRALHELDERLRKRERELMERIEREEVEAAQRIRAGFEDVQRRQIEQLERVVERAASTYSDEAAQQFAGVVRANREDAARRLSRELDRAVEVFAREAESVLAERLAHVGDAGAQRLERRLSDATALLEQQREDRLQALDARIAEFEADFRRRLEELGADAEAERAVLEARVQELIRRVDAAGAVPRSR